ncbi:MAG: tyrosine--tRNA ligase [Pseudomonadales bacterium]
MAGDLLAEFEWRGLVSQATSPEELAEHLSGGSRTIYCGFDPTADSLHIGSLVPLLALRRVQQLGHRPIILLGGATGLVGDPSFKAVERALNGPEVVSGWVAKLRKQVAPFVDFGGADSDGDSSIDASNAAIIANNLDWTQNLDVLSFLRDVGKHFSVNAMIQKESVKQRIEREGEGISFTEFTYMVLQSLDFAKLNELNDCTVQIGGSDQWGNITGGIDLTRRMNQQQVFGITLPLVTKSDGTKFGKTESGTIWLDPTKTSPYAFYQFWLNSADDDVYKYLRYFTFLGREEIEQIEAGDAAASGRPSAQGVLAREVTSLVHGQAGFDAALRISEALFSGDLTELTQDDLEQLALDGLPCLDMAVDSVTLVDALVETGLAQTPRGEVTIGQARKFIQGNAVSVNGSKIAEIDATLDRDGALHKRFHLLKRGKKLFHLIKWG